MILERTVLEPHNLSFLTKTLNTGTPKDTAISSVFFFEVPWKVWAFRTDYVMYRPSFKMKFAVGVPNRAQPQIVDAVQGVILYQRVKDDRWSPCNSILGYAEFGRVVWSSGIRQYISIPGFPYSGFPSIGTFRRMSGLRKWLGATSLLAMTRSNNTTPVMEVNILHWISGVICYDDVRSDRYRAASFVEKLCERLHRWYGQVICAGKILLSKIYQKTETTMA